MRVTEIRIARICLGVLALHVVDDSFLQPQPGTSARDHLASGLVPTVALAVAAWAYPRWRPGARGICALACGVFGIVLGIEGAYYAAAGRTSGDDYTGFLALAAGAVLVALGAVVLWRSRRGGSRRRRYLRRTAFALGALAVTFLVVYPVSLAYVVTHVARPNAPPPDLGAPHEDVTLTTSDGLTLGGWYVPSRNRAAVVAVPGRKGPQAHARMLVRQGYGVLLFDRRGEGDSEGDPNAFGWRGDPDLEAALDFLRSRPDLDPSRIGGLGLSVGGEMLVDFASGEKALRAVVSEGAGIRSVRETLDIPGGAKILPTLVFGVVTPAVALFSNSLPPPSLADLVGRVSPRALFLIEAERGQGGETELTPTYVDAAGEPTEHWLVPGSTHTGGIEAAPSEYERRVLGFFDAALMPAG